MKPETSVPAPAAMPQVPAEYGATAARRLAFILRRQPQGGALSPLAQLLTRHRSAPVRLGGEAGD